MGASKVPADANGWVALPSPNNKALFELTGNYLAGGGSGHLRLRRNGRLLGLASNVELI